MKFNSAIQTLPIALLALWSGCTEPFDATRAPPERGTLGEEVTRVFCLRVAAAAWPTDLSGYRAQSLCSGELEPDEDTPPRLRAMLRNRVRLARALDAALPVEMGADLDAFMLELVPLYEEPDNRVPNTTRALADFLDRLAADDAAVQALARMSGRDGYRHLREALGMMRPLLAYPDLQPLVETALTSVDSGGALEADWRQLIEVLTLEFATYEPAPAELEEPTLALARSVLFSQDAAFSEGRPIWTILRDERGLVEPAWRGAVLPGPFVDGDGDGLADIDDLARFIDIGGGPVIAPTPFRIPGELEFPRDSFDRALGSDGLPLYGAIDADRTLLTGLVRELGPWFAPVEGLPDPPAIEDFVVALPAFLGPDETRLVSFGNAEPLEYPSWSTEDGALFDLTWGLSTILDDAETEDTLNLLRRLIDEHEPELAELVGAMFDVNDRSDFYPDNNLVRNAIFWDEMRTLAAHIAQEPGLLEDLLRAIGDPRTAALGDIGATFMRTRDRVDFNPADINGPPVGAPVTPVDRTQPDLSGNASLWQRTVHAIYDLTDVRFCNKEGAKLNVDLGLLTVTWPLFGDGYGECELMAFQNVALDYARSVIGREEVSIDDATLQWLLDIGADIGISADDLLEQQTGIDGMTTHPTPQGLNRVVFTPWNDFINGVFDPPLTRDGLPVRDIHSGLIFSWEYYEWPENNPEGKPGFYDGLTPLLLAFDGPETDPALQRHRLDLFLELIGILHRHWPSPESRLTQRADPGAPLYSMQSNIRSWEVLMADALAESPDQPVAGFPGAIGVLREVHEFVILLDALEVRPGVDGVDVLAAALENMFDPDRSCGGAAEGCLTEGLPLDQRLRTRDGQAWVCRMDGSCRAPGDGDVWDPEGQAASVTPFYLIVHALRAMDRAYEESPESRERMHRVRGRLVDQLLAVRENPDGSWEFENPRARATLLAIVDHVQNRVDAHRLAGDLSDWAEGLTPRFEAYLSQPVPATTVAFLNAIQDDPVARDAVMDLIAYLVDQSSGADAFDTTLVAVHDMLQTMGASQDIAPALHGFSQLFAPNALDVIGRGGELDLDTSVTEQTLDLVRGLTDLDDTQLLRRLLANLVSLPDDGSSVTPLETILEVIAEVNSGRWPTSAALNETDIRNILTRSRDFLLSDRRGLERLYDVIHERRLH